MYKILEKDNLKKYRDKALELGKELYKSGEITQDQYNNTYYNLFIRT